MVDSLETRSLIWEMSVLNPSRSVGLRRRGVIVSACLTTRTLNGPANGNRRYRTTWQRRMRFRGLKFDSDTSGAAGVSAFARSGVARRNQGV